ncbi:MAG: GAF domain-containing protein [Cytophagales bacterium]|nr:GAF domain-containing protein [Bernardetiaceae bacterium]MDW8210012.1 GAF domain-containing protein [Cytophagales bacterium]
MINRLYQFFIHNSIKDIEDPIIRRKVKLALIISLVFLFSSFNSSISIIFGSPALTPVIIASLVAHLVTYLIIFMGYHLQGRFLLALIVNVVLFIFHTAAIREGELPLASFSFATLVPLSVGVSIFSYTKERFFLFFCTGASVVSLILVPFSPFKGFIEGLNYEVLRSDFIFAIVVIIVSITSVILLFLNSREEEKSFQQYQETLERLELRQKEIEQSNQELLKSVESLKTLQQSEEKRQKSVLYQAELSEVLRAHSDDLEKACDRATALITRYIQADAGALFIHQEEENGTQYLEMVACYANGRRKYLHKKFATTEGLVGQVFMEKAYICASNVPEEHLSIASGLGEHAPTHLLLVPMMYSGNAIGVMEFASFRPFDRVTIEIADRLSDLTAAVVSGIRNNQRTRKLLEQTQQQAEDLRAREEEMRQNMEELVATQEEMSRINNELSYKSVAMDSLLAIAELDKNKNFLSVNDNFVQILGYTKQELLSMKHYELVPEDVYSDQEYELWWEKLISGRSFVDEIVRKTKNGTKITLRSYYQPIISPATQEVTKIIKYCYPVNDPA